MPKGKAQTTGPNQSVNVLRWTDEMDQVLMNAFTEELTKGNRYDGSWTSEAYSNDKPQAIKWRTMQIKHYDTLKELFGADRAIGKRAATARQRTPQMQHDNINLNDAQDDISMPEQVVEELDEGNFSPPNLESLSPTYAQSHQTTGTSGSRGTKLKAQMIELVEGQLEKMSSGLGLVVDALNKGNCISDKLHDVADRQVTIADRHAVIAERQVTTIEKRNEIFQKQLNIIQHTRLRVYSEAEV
ncbi:hypothetical protein TanjilG_01357 [Lupinus angustifolius]|uniref:Myb/SANT-like domain-containing protein n=1 Tax=Lupinus angustifolius TaxID=3871 RepID=A0A1J7HVR7_LUPAN|nr:hypothetical protein TanjilG_01357 [Lupinus angustifolius]